MIIQTPTTAAPVIVTDITTSSGSSEHPQSWASNSSVRSGPTQSPCRSWLIYLLTARADGRGYVGLTSRPLQDRLRAHSYQAARPRAVRAGGLMAALRVAAFNGKTLEQVFTVQVIGVAATAEEARQLERHLIELHGCRKPNGYNDLPGGGIGGMGCALPLNLKMPDGQDLKHASIGRAIEHANGQRHCAGQTAFNPATVYARLAAGWTASEALGYVPHEDGRGVRDPITLDATKYRSLREASKSGGVGVDALRSRLHRRRTSGSPTDLARDLRRSSDNHRPRRSPLLGLVLPNVVGSLTVQQYADTVGVPKSTVLYRWHMALRAGIRPAELSPIALRDLLTAQTDRRIITTLRLPDGRQWRGGERDLVRRVLADPDIEASRVKRLSESGVRRRLRSLTESERPEARLVSWAFGFVRRER